MHRLNFLRRLLVCLVFGLGILGGTGSASGQETNWQGLNANVVSLFKTKDFAAALPVAKAALVAAEAEFGPDDLKTATAAGNLGSVFAALGQHEQAMPHLRRALEIRQAMLGAHKKTAASFYRLAASQRKTGLLVAAAGNFKAALIMREGLYGIGDIKTETALFSLASVLKSAKKYDEAEGYYRQALALRERIYGADDPKTAARLNALGLLLRKKGDYQGAEAAYLRALAIRRMALGPVHKDIADVLGNLAFLKKVQKDTGAARDYYRQALQMRERLYGANSRKLVTTLRALGNLERRAGEKAVALRLLRRVLAIQELALTPGHKDVRKTRKILIAWLVEDDARPAAEVLLQRNLDVRAAQDGETAPSLLGDLDSLMRLQGEQGAWVRAAATARRALAIREAHFGPDGAETSFSLNQLAIYLENGGDAALAEPLYRRALVIDQGLYGAGDIKTLIALQNLAQVHLSLRQYAKAEAGFRAALALLRGQPDAALTTINETSAGLVLALRAQGDLPAAEVVLRDLLARKTARYGPEHLETARAMNELAMLLNTRGRFARSEELMRRALAIRGAELGVESPGYATSLNNLAEILNARGKLQEAARLYRQAIDILRENDLVQSSDYAAFLNNLAGLLGKTGEFVQATKLYRQALALRRAARPPDAGNLAQSLGNLAAILQSTGELGEAEQLLQQSIALLDANPGLDPALGFAGRNNLAELYKMQGKYAKAEALHRQVLADRIAYFGPDHPDVATSLNNLSATLLEQDRFNEARAGFERALAINIAVFGENSAQSANSRNSLAAYYKARGDYAQAAGLYARALEVRKQVLGPDHPDTGTSFGNLAGVENLMGNYAKAGPLYRRALAVSETAYGARHPQTALSLNNLALFLFSSGEGKKAEPLFRRALRIQQSRFGAVNIEVATTLNNLANLLETQGDFTQSEGMYRRALAINTELFGKKSRRVAASQNNLAGLLSTTGKAPEAEALYRSALSIRKETLGPLHQDTATSMNNLALLLARQGQPAKAEALYRDALDISRAALGAGHPKVALVLTNLALLKASTGAPGLAADLFDQALAIRTLPANRDQLKRYARSISAGAANGLVAGQVDAALAAFAAVQWGMKGGAGAALADTAARLATGAPELAALVRKKQDQQAQYARLSNDVITAYGQGDARLADITRQAVADVSRQLFETAAELDRRYPEITTLASTEPLDAAATAALLQPGEAIALIVPGYRALAGDLPGSVYIVRWDGIIASAVLERGNGLQVDMALLRCGIVPTDAGCDAALSGGGGGGGDDGGGDDGARTTRAAESLDDDPVPQGFDLDLAYSIYGRIFGGVEGGFDGVEQLIIVPGDDALAVLPFQLLLSQPPDPDLGGADAFRAANWLIRDFAITMLPTVSSLKALRELAVNTPAAPKPFLGIGDPVVGRRDAISCRGFKSSPSMPVSGVIDTAGLFQTGGNKSVLTRNIAIADPKAVRRLARLPETRCELLQVADYLGGGDFLLDKDATETRLKSLSEAGVLANYRVLSFATHGLIAGQVGAAEPALVMTPPDQASLLDDGLLTASEVATLKLNAEFVILSACNTAASLDGDSESLSGLARAFFYAGAKTLLVSHWPVNSDAAVRLTTGMFASLQDDPDLGRARAMQASMLAILDDPDSRAWQLDPVYWAPFSLVGEGGAG